MYAKEAEIVTEDFIAAENTYNLKVGGFGGFDYINKKGLSGTAAGVQKRNELMKDQVWVSEWAKSQQRGIKNISEARRQTMIDRRKKTIQKRFGKDVFPSFKGKKHTKKTREIIGEKNSKHQSGTKNSQFGTRWIYSNEHQISKKLERMTIYLRVGMKVENSNFEECRVSDTQSILPNIDIEKYHHNFARNLMGCAIDIHVVFTPIGDIMSVTMKNLETALAGESMVLIS